MTNELLTTKQLAERLNVSDATIRTWNSRYSALIQEGTHFVKDGGRKFWTNAALQLFQGETQIETPVETESVSPALQPVAEAIAWEVIAAQLPGAVQASVNRILSNPTELDQERLLQILGQVGAGVSLARMAGIFAGGLERAIAASQDNLKALEGGTDG